MTGYFQTKQQFFKQKNDDIIKALKEAFVGKNPPINAWKRLIDDIKKSPKFKELPDYVIFGLECACPTGGMSIDLLIAYVDENNQKHACIVEAKNWTDDYIKSLNFSDNRRRDNFLHPQIQAYRQAMSFNGYTDVGEQYSVTPYVYITCSKNGIQDIIDKNSDTYSASVKVVNDIDIIINEVLRSSKTRCNDLQKTEIFFDLCNASYQPSKSVMNAMSNLMTNAPAFILTEKQQKVVDEIMKNIKDGKKIIRIKGAAGSGKTAILIHLYLELIKQSDNKYRPILLTGAYNTDYYRSLYPKISGFFEFSHALNQIIRKGDRNRYVVLMDEAQHNDKGEVQKILNMNAILVVCYHESQTLRAINCVKELIKLESKPYFVSIELTESMRYNGSTIAEKNINNYLQGSPVIADNQFDFQTCTDFQDFQNKLKDLINNNPKSTVATVGLLCNDSDKFTKAGNPNSILRRKWYEKAECDWMKYVMEKNYLQNKNDIWVGTWWMQGLDVDYIALIVGDDAILTDEGIKADWHKSALYQTIITIAEHIGLPHYLKNTVAKVYAKNIADYIDNSSDEQLKLEFEVEFSQLVKNYYYILLTRARKGCIVYFANNTRKHPPTI